ncbi:MAG: hypothetical protein ACI9HK_004762 [Pirellulaceae bacterium]|jgi:hypothetical protein
MSVAPVDAGVDRRIPPMDQLATAGASIHESETRLQTLDEFFANADEDLLADAPLGSLF